DHHRAVSQISEKINRQITSTEQICVWGNHSPTMYADYRNATSNGESVQDMITEPHRNTEVFKPKIAGRGAPIIAAPGSS
ncbi:malate dehydrogenase, partial [Neisseria sp. P0009.S003]